MFYIIFAGLLFLLSNQPVWADGSQVENFQGVIISNENLPHYIVVNEKKLLIDEGVIIKNAKEKEAAIKDLKNGRWVYVAAEQKAEGLTALRIYLLPKRIKNREKVNYPFMKNEEKTDD